MRPCFIIVDREHAGSISSRKLVIETAKMNVITAYSGKEALETLRRFPAVDGVVVDCLLPDLDPDTIVEELRKISQCKILAITSQGPGVVRGADFEVKAFEPEALLERLQQIYSEQMTEILKNEQRLQEEEERRQR